MSETDPVGRDFLPVIFAFLLFPDANGTKKAKISMELKPTDLRSISSVLENVWDLASKGFDQGLRMGCEEERNRTRHFFHEVLSSKILVASFLAHEIHQKLAASGAEEAEDMARLTKLLQEAIEAIVRGAEKY
jgi:hypothetical protein